MKKIAYENIKRESRFLDDGELVLVYQEQTENITMGEELQVKWCLGTIIKKKLYTSDAWCNQPKDYKKTLTKAMQQVAMIIETGWSLAAEGEDEFGGKKYLFRCAYCEKEVEEAKGSCECAEVQMRKTAKGSGIITKSR